MNQALLNLWKKWVITIKELEAIKEAGVAWRELNATLEYDDSVVSVNAAGSKRQRAAMLIFYSKNECYKIELTGAAVPREPSPPIVLHYNVRLLGDKLTQEPVIVKNTCTIADDWGSEDRCLFRDSDAKDSAKDDGDEVRRRKRKKRPSESQDEARGRKVRKQQKQSSVANYLWMKTRAWAVKRKSKIKQR